MTDLDALKAAARARAKRLRAGHDPALGAALSGHVLRVLPPPAGAIVGGFWPLPGEIDITPLLHALHARGHAVALPDTPPAGAALAFRGWSPGCAMRPGRFGTMVPDGPALTPGWLLVPLLAWDDAGHRLGFGGGYYDRTIARLTPSAVVGCAYDAQRVDAVPVGPYDAPLSAVATELGVTVFQAI